MRGSRRGDFGARLVGARSIWLAAGSLVVIVIGAFAPWATAFGFKVDGTDDELVGIVASVAAVALGVFTLTGRRLLAAAPLLAGIVAVVLVSHDIADPAGPFGGPGPNFLGDHDPAGPLGGPGPNVQLGWGIWLALGGAIGLVLASIGLWLRDERHSAPSARDTRALSAETPPTTLGDEVLVRAFAKRLNVWGRERDQLLATLGEQVHLKAAGLLVDALTPVRDLDYNRYPIRLVVSSPTVAKRLGSVEKEPFTVEWIEQNVKAGVVFYDIGANVGPYSLIAAKVSPGGARIFSFEPAPASFRDLTRNVALNDCSGSVTPLPVALWSETKILSARWRSFDSGASRHQIGGDHGDSRVIGIRLDDLIERLALPVPNHAKVDVDGYELEVLKGAGQTLSRPEWRSIIIELDPKETERNKKVRALLAAAGFGPGLRHARTPTRRYPKPDLRPDVYWTFTRAAD